MSFSLAEYQEQRVLREKRRKEFIRRYQTIKIRIGLEPSNTFVSPHAPIQRQTHIQRHPSLASNSSPAPPASASYQHQLSLNISLKQALIATEAQTSSQMSSMDKQIQTLKNSYQTELKQIILLSNDEKKSQKTRLEDLIRQIKQGLLKNKQVVAQNTKLMQELDSKINFQKYQQELKTEYETKLKQFDDILEDSNAKVELMQEDLNQQEILQKALQNEAFITSLLSKIPEEGDLSLDELSKVLEEKNELIDRLSKNTVGKEEEVVKIKDLCQGYKEVFEKVSRQKVEMVQKNNEMKAELYKIGEIFKQILGEAGDLGEEGEEGDDDQDDQGDDEQEEIEDETEQN